MSNVDVLIVGGGDAGLAMSSLLSHDGREHLVLERRDRLGGAWQDRWDQFTLVTPNWTSSFPGWRYDGNNMSPGCSAMVCATDTASSPYERI